MECLYWLKGCNLRKDTTENRKPPPTRGQICSPEESQALYGGEGAEDHSAGHLRRKALVPGNQIHEQESSVM